MQKAPVYIGVFVEDSKSANKEIRHQVGEGLKEITENIEDADPQIHNDLNNFENLFKLPNDSYHITTLFIGGNPKKLNAKQAKQFENFKSNQKTFIKIDCIVYVPGFIVCGYCSDTDGIEVDNKYPHVTLFLGNDAKAVESNNVLESLANANPEMFAKKEFKTGKYPLNYNKFDDAYVIGKKISINAVTGNNFTHGKKWSVFI